MALFCLAAMVRKDAPGGDVFCLLNGCRIATNEAEARGLYLRWVQDTKPGYAIVDLLCCEVPFGALRAGMAECVIADH